MQQKCKQYKEQSTTKVNTFQLNILSLLIHYFQKNLSTFYQTFDYQKAIEFLQSVHPKTHYILCQIAKCQSYLNNYFNSYQSALQALKMDKYCTQSGINLGNSLIHLQSPSLLMISEALGILKGVENSQQINELITKIEQIHSNTKINCFIEFLKSKGAIFPKIQLVEGPPHYRKIIAKDKIEKDQLVLLIPKDLLITLQTTRNSQLVRKIYDQKIYLRSPKHCLLSIYLLQTKQLGEKSPFYLYINLLPSNYDTFPLNYSKEQMEQLKGSSFKQQIQQKIIDMQKDYESIVQLDQKFKRFSYEEFRWARMTVSSRIFGIVVNKVKTDALVPLADMLNHQVPKQTNWYYSDVDNGFVIKNIKLIDIGSEIFDSYGHKCNSRFLLNYGFTIFQNPSDEVISIPIASHQKQDHDYPKQIILRINKHLQTKQFEDMIGVLRFATLTREQVINFQISPEQANSTKFVSQENQINAWVLAEEVMKKHLSEYPTSLRDDKLMLNDPNLSANKHNCICLRFGQKQILNFYLSMSKKIQRYFKSHKKANDLKPYTTYLQSLQK